MNKRTIVNSLFASIIKQDALALKTFFHKDAIIKWHCSNECFTVDEYMIANCEYPGEWTGEIERLEVIDDLVISVAHIYLQDQSASFHVSSFIQFKDDKIIELNEYWGDDGEAPAWREDKHIGTIIK